MKPKPNKKLRLFKRYLTSHLKFRVPKTYLYPLYKIANKKKIQRIKLIHKKEFNKINAIFIHNPKVAGTSISKSLFSVNMEGTLSAFYYKKILGDSYYNSMFKFTFIRNPWSRLLSAYNQIIKEDLLFNNKKKPSFEDFTKNWLNKRRLFQDPHLIPQYYYMYDDNNNLLVDFIGKFEQLNKDIETISKKLGIPISLPHLNKSSDANYKNHYDDEMIQIVTDLYQRDIALFNYMF